MCPDLSYIMFNKVCGSTLLTISPDQNCCAVGLYVDIFPFIVWVLYVTVLSRSLDPIPPYRT